MTDECNMYGHQHRDTCSCGCGCGCGEHSEDGGHCHCAQKFLKIADEAWVEVLKDKIKTKILAHKGEHMDKLAEIIASANGEKWKYLISAKTKGHEFKDKLKEFMSSCD